jgi:hypothetical protein
MSVQRREENAVQTIYGDGLESAVCQGWTLDGARAFYQHIND